MKFSLILATYGRYEEIIIFLDSLLNQSYKNFELIIVDQNKDDRITLLSQSYKLDIQVIKSQVKGLSINRNIGLKYAAGDIIAFPDDDCEYNTDTLENIALFFTNNTAYSFYTCNTKEKNSQLSIVSNLKNDTNITKNNIMRAGISFTIFVRHDSLKSFKFDERLGIGADFGSGEESDLLCYLLKNKNKGYYYSNKYIFHPHKPDTAEKFYQYGKGYGALYKKAVFYYGFHILLISFLFTLFKGIIKICLQPRSKLKIAMLKGRIHGFTHYKIARKLPIPLINGYFLCRRLTGIERYAYEITKRLDSLIHPGEISIIVPTDANNIPNYININIIKYGKKIQHVFWQMFTLQFFLLVHHRYLIIDFGNTCLPLTPGVVFLHDIYCEFFPEDFSGFRDKIARFYNRYQYRLIARKAKRIGTVSFFSKRQIAETYHINPDRITVIYSSWNHFLTIAPDYTVFNDFPALTDSFFFSLGSISKRKNIKWIVNYAVEHPSDIFALSGDVLPTASGSLSDSVPKNIILLGYLNDSKVKALMEKCKAFILPSYYEGFGLTPLEALSCGTQIIVAKAASLPEIYGNTAHYIDPFNINVDLDKLLNEPVDPPDDILKKYSYDNSAKKVYDLIREAIIENK